MESADTVTIRRAVAGFVVAGGVALVACLTLAPAFPLRYGGAASLVIAVSLAVGIALLDKFAIRVRVRGERIAMTTTDALLIAAIVLLSPAFAPLVAAAGCAGGQLLNRRSGLKSTFNVAQDALSAAAAAAVVAGLLSLGLPLLVAVLPAPLVYGLVNHTSVASIVARVERLPTLVVLRGRMARLALVGAVLAEATGVALALVV